jgi:aspartyl-tRNA(Asn)/glutamyl-tRNA(Gln) amidotransferase subunit C
LSISEKTVEYVAALARLKLGKEEEKSMLRQMQSILSYFEKLNSLDTSGIKPMEHIEHTSNVFREDLVIDSYARETVLKNAPQKDEKAFIVPRIIE